MANIVFVQRLWYEYPGIEILSAFLKQSGHSVDVVIGEKISQFGGVFKGVDIIAFSVMTGFQGWALSLGRQLKEKYNSCIIFGGPHPTYFPEIVNEDGVDVICRGEGEGALLDLAERLDTNKGFTDIPNLWVKHKGKIFKNGLRPLIENLDDLPFPDREIYYDKYSFIGRNSHRAFMAGRGCPYGCSFCFNAQLKQMYKDKGKYVRMRSPGNVLEEIKSVKGKYLTEKIFFHDDTFVLNHKWLREFLGKYSEQIRLPFFCQARADTFTEELIKNLKRAGCQAVFFAIESGDETIRRKVLNKPISNEKIIKSARWLKENGIKISTYNMLGIPGERVEQALKTVELNMAIKADYPRCSFLTPYPGTRIAELAREKNHMSKDADFEINSNSQQSEMFMATTEGRELKNLHSLFQTAILFPWTYPLVKRLIRLPLGLVFKLWWAFIYFLVFTKSEGRSMKVMLVFALRNFKVSVWESKKKA